MDAFKFESLRIRLEEIKDVKQMCHPINDAYIIASLNLELEEIEGELKDKPIIDMTNVLMFDQMKRRNPIKHKLNDKLADVIDLNAYRNKLLKKVS